MVARLPNRSAVADRDDMIRGFAHRSMIAGRSLSEPVRSGPDGWMTWFSRSRPRHGWYRAL